MGMEQGVQRASNTQGQQMQSHLGAGIGKMGEGAE